ILESFLMAIIPVAALRILSRTAPEHSKRLRLAMATVVCLYPPLLLQSSVAMAEACLMTLVALMAWVLVTPLPMRRLLSYSLALAFAVVLTHGRGVVVAAAFGVALLIQHRID